MKQKLEMNREYYCYKVSLGSLIYISNILDKNPKNYKYSMNDILSMLEIEEKDYSFIINNIENTSKKFIDNYTKNEFTNNLNFNIDNYISEWKIKLENKKYELIINKDDMTQMFIVENNNERYIIEKDITKLEEIVKKMVTYIACFIE